jgi:hypothetical protein
MFINAHILTRVAQALRIAWFSRITSPNNPAIKPNQTKSNRIKPPAGGKTRLKAEG